MVWWRCATAMMIMAIILFIPCCGCSRCHWSERMRWGWHKFSISLGSEADAKRNVSTAAFLSPLSSKLRNYIQSVQSSTRLKSGCEKVTSNSHFKRNETRCCRKLYGWWRALDLTDRSSLFLRSIRQAFVSICRDCVTHIYTACTFAASEY